MMMPGMFLSQPPMPTRPSKELPRVTKLDGVGYHFAANKDAFMPCVPMVMPSWMVMVLNSMGVPPASRTPCLTASAIWRRWKLQVPISVQVLAMPMIGLCRSSF